MSDSSSDEDEGLSWWDERLQQIKENDPSVKSIVSGSEDIQDMTDEECEELGRYFANNTHLTEVDFAQNALNDHKASCLFRGLTRSSSIAKLDFDCNELSAAGVRSIVPFLQNANNLTKLNLCRNNIQSDGFNVLFRALSNTPIKELLCLGCDIKSIEIDSQRIPYNLTTLNLGCNEIDAAGCRELTKLLQGDDATLERLYLSRNKIDDNGVDILVDALQNNTSLIELGLGMNDEISRGNSSLLRLVNDISSIDATLRSNHTLTRLYLYMDGDLDRHLALATKINSIIPEEFRGREKVIRTQLHSETRAEFDARQGVNHSVYSEINPLHLPEVLALVGRRHGQKELYLALKSSIAGLISTVNRKECIRQQRDYHLAKAKQLDAELAAIEEAERGAVHVESESRSIKKRRAC